MPPTPSASGVCMGAGCKAAGCKAAGLQAAGLQAAGLKAARVALQAAGLQAAGLQAARVALQAAGWTWAVCAKGRKRCTVAFGDSKFATPLARQRLQRTKPRMLSKKQHPKLPKCCKLQHGMLQRPPPTPPPPPPRGGAAPRPPRLSLRLRY